MHEPVNIGNPNEMTLLDMAERDHRADRSRRSEIVFEALPIDDPQVRQPDITRARELLGWEPEVDVREGLRRTIEHYSRIGWAAPRSDELLRGQEPRSDLQGDRPAQPQLRVPGGGRRG